MLAGLVDVYLVLEVGPHYDNVSKRGTNVFQSNYTSYGSGKPLTFLDKFREGWMAKFQEKILYVFLPFFPKVCCEVSAPHTKMDICRCKNILWKNIYK